MQVTTPLAPPELRPVVCRRNRPWVLLGAPGRTAPPAGTPVRLPLSAHRPSTPRSCDGSLGAAETISEQNEDGETERALAAPIDGCDRACGFVAILRPLPDVLQPVPPGDPAALEAVRAAKEEARRSRRTEGEPRWDAESVVRSGDATFAMVAIDSCNADEEEGLGCFPVRAVVTVVRPGAGAEVVISRPAAFPPQWGEEIGDGWINFSQIFDWNGDGVVELIEDLGGNPGRITRVVAVSDRRAGEAVWRATYDYGVSIRPATTQPR